jgi:CheY-like chemotaxis protein
LEDKFGPDIIKNEKIVVHDCDNPDMVYLGKLPSGGGYGPLPVPDVDVRESRPTKWPGKRPGEGSGEGSGESSGGGMTGGAMDEVAAARAEMGIGPQPMEYRPKVLIVDDNRDGAEMLALLIGEAGYETFTACDPVRALELAVATLPDVAILDIGLPIMDGYTLGRELRALLGDAAPALVALTGYGLEKDRAKSQEAHFARHLVKPVASARLIGVIEALIAGRGERCRPVPLEREEAGT